jgi:hypothetical protein
MNSPLRRRDLLKLGSVAAMAPWLSLRADEERPNLPRVAAINSIYRLRSHAYHIAGRFIHGYTINGLHHQPPFRLVRMFNHQQPPDDLGPEVCKKHGIELCSSVAEALGGDKLDVDAVLLIIEHGEYPLNERHQILYPRFEMFQEIVDVFRKNGRNVPVFVDKHLSFDHQKAAKMVAASKELNFGLMAGSSLPVTWRIPELAPPLGTPFEEGIAVIGYDRSTWEIYLFHVLEVLQCMMERRSRAGETGVKSVQTLTGDAVWKAGDEGRWSWTLLEHALSRCPSRNYGRVREQVKNPLVTLIEYADGAKGAVFNLVEATSDFAFAGRIKGQAEPVSTCFYLPAPPGARFFDPLTFNIEKFFDSGRPPYPVERTLLTTTICDHAIRSQHLGGKVISDPSLLVRYQAPEDDGHFRGRFIDRS